MVAPAFMFSGALLTVEPPLRSDLGVSVDGCRFSLKHTFRQDGVPGYVFEAVEEKNNQLVGHLSLLITNDFDAVARTGHMGVELADAVRKQGWVVRLSRPALAVFRAHGLEEILLVCESGHQSQIESITQLGAEPYDTLPAKDNQPALRRFRLRLTPRPS